MKTRSALVLAPLLLAAAVSGAGKAASHPVAALDAAFARALVSGDVEALANCYAEEAVMYPPDELVLRGRAAIRASFDGMLKSYTVTVFDYEADGYADSSTSSSSWGTWTMSMTPKAGGEAVTTTGRASATAKRVGGKWLYVADHASLPLPPPPPAK